MKLRKHIYIDETLLNNILEDNRKNLSVYISNLIQEDILKKEATETKLDKEEKSIKYLLNHINTQGQILLNLVTNLIENPNEVELTPYHQLAKYKNAKKIVDSEKARKKDRMKGVANE